MSRGITLRMARVNWCPYYVLDTIGATASARDAFLVISCKTASAYTLLFSISIAEGMKAHTAPSVGRDSLFIILCVSPSIGTATNSITNKIPAKSVSMGYHPKDTNVSE